MTPDLDQTLTIDRGQPAATLHMLRPADLADWRARQGEAVAAWLDANGFAAKAGETLLLPGGGAVAGLGSEPAVNPWMLAPSVARLPAGLYRCPFVADAPGTALGWALAHYRFSRYRSDAGDTRLRTLLLPEAVDIEDILRQARATALVRDLINTPAADLGPAALADAITAQGSRLGAETAVVSGDELLAQGYPAIHAVGRAAGEAPRLVDLRWGDVDHPRVTLVGKGVCFDSGGLDIKSANGMALMKKDMGGAAHALALAVMVMEARLPVRLRLLVPAVENAIGADAFRPGDVLTTRAGITVEIGNTDAEGRLILCDALTEADRETPDLLLDFATLTGAARVALGPDLPALFSPDDALAEALLSAGSRSCDPLWRLPLWAPYADYLKSTIADINNAGDSSFAGAITAALFLQRFVRKTRRWGHIDLFAWMPAAKPGQPKGGEAMTLRACWSLLNLRYPAV